MLATPLLLRAALLGGMGGEAGGADGPGEGAWTASRRLAQDATKKASCADRQKAGPGNIMQPLIPKFELRLSATYVNRLKLDPVVASTSVIVAHRHGAPPVVFALLTPLYVIFNMCA
jgi:hypothetical protein